MLITLIISITIFYYLFSIYNYYENSIKLLLIVLLNRKQIMAKPGTNKKNKLTVS